MMKAIINVLFYLFLLLATVNAENKSTEQDLSQLTNFADQLYSAIKNQQRLPHFSQYIGDSDPLTAYKVQSLLVSRIINSSSAAKQIAGYKAGLTSKVGQAKFKVESPVYAVLFDSGQLKSDDIIRRSDSHRLMLETELGFIIKQAINRPIESIEQLASKLESVVPVIELPDINLLSPTSISGNDLIASNVASNQFILGIPQAINSQLSLNELVIQLDFAQPSNPANHMESPKQNAQYTRVFSAKGSDASGDQWRALLDLINHQVNLGYHPKPGDLLITGALGKMIPAKVGNYRANFGQLGIINFEVKQ